MFKGVKEDFKDNPSEFFKQYETFTKAALEPTINQKITLITIKNGVNDLL